MKRKIVDFSKLNDHILQLLVDRFPDGYDSEDCISFTNAQGEITKCLELKTEDTIFLVKVSTRLKKAMVDFEIEEDEEAEEQPDHMTAWESARHSIDLLEDEDTELNPEDDNKIIS